MAAHAQPFLTPEQYLEIERAAVLRSEYYDGRMYAMAGGTQTHQRLKDRLAFALNKRLENGPCEAGTSDLRVSVSYNGLYTYPDVFVLCGESKLLDGHKDTLLNPVLIAEILSTSTERYDRIFKFSQYRQIETLQEYVIVAQNEARVEVQRRQPDGTWSLREFVGLDAVCQFASIECEVPLSELYANIAFEN
jgi:Uma2 family endonuclease